MIAAFDSAFAAAVAIICIIDTIADTGIIFNYFSRAFARQAVFGLAVII